MSHLTIFYSPHSPSADFVLHGIYLPDVEVFPFCLRTAFLPRKSYYGLKKAGFRRLAALAGYPQVLKRRLRREGGKLLFFDCLPPDEYRIAASLTRASEKHIFLWNPLGRWFAGEGECRAVIAGLKEEGFSISTFDMDDSARYGLRPMRNVARKMTEYLGCPIENDFYFVGAPKGRGGRLAKLENFLLQQGYRTKFILAGSRDENIEQVENIRNASVSRCLVDLRAEGQRGLTLRPFDALFLGKKLITDSEDIERADFYHPDNILLLKGDNYEDIPAFMERPMHEVPLEIASRYEVNCWVRENFLTDYYKESSR